MSITEKWERVKLIMSFTIILSIVYPAIDFSLSSCDIKWKWLFIILFIVSSLSYILLNRIISTKWKEFKKLLDNFPQFIEMQNLFSFVRLSNYPDDSQSIRDRYELIKDRFNKVLITPRKLNECVDDFNLLLNDFFKEIVKKFIDKKLILEKSVIQFNEYYPSLRRAYEKYIDKYEELNESLSKKLPNNIIYKLP